MRVNSGVSEIKWANDWSNEWWCNVMMMYMESDCCDQLNGRVSDWSNLHLIINDIM